MAKFYSSNITASVCGRPVRISHSTSYPTIQVNLGRRIRTQVLVPNSKMQLRL